MTLPTLFTPERTNMMARKTVLVSDFSAKEIADPKQSATISVRSAGAAWSQA
ncbi:MAG: hypothetical protein M3P18_05025 [Actinomycetota bacterium]|nr:hypothetical protein [Actinomycetota bacterium]